MNLPKQTQPIIRCETGSHQAQAEEAGLYPAGYCYSSTDCSGNQVSGGGGSQGACKQNGGKSYKAKSNTACISL